MLPLVDTDVWFDFLRGKAHGVGLNDALIAATAVNRNACLYTLNVKHYPSLRKNQVVQPYGIS